MSKVVTILVVGTMLVLLWFAIAGLLLYAEERVPYGDLIPSHGHQGGLELWCKREGGTWTPPPGAGKCVISGNAWVRSGETLYIGGVLEYLENHGTIHNSGLIFLDGSAGVTNFSDGGVVNFGSILIAGGANGNYGHVYNYDEIFISVGLYNGGTIYNLCEGYIDAGLGDIYGDGSIQGLDECSYIPGLVK